MSCFPHHVYTLSSCFQAIKLAQAPLKPCNVKLGYKSKDNKPTYILEFSGPRPPGLTTRGRQSLHPPYNKEDLLGLLADVADECEGHKMGETAQALREAADIVRSTLDCAPAAKLLDS